MPLRYDAIIVGGGHNGLVTAAYLSRAGRKVLVLERRAQVGGCCVTEELWPGYRVSTAAYLSSLLSDKVVDDLELKRFGYQVDAKDPAFFSPFPDGRHLFMWQDERKTLAEIAKFSPHDAEQFPKYEKHIERLARVVESLLLVTPPNFPPRSALDLPEYLKLLGRMRGLSTPEIIGLVKIFTQSAADFLDEWFESEEIKVTLATDGVIGANGGPRSPGTAYILMHHCMGGVNGKRGLWGFVRGGMGAISNAIADSAREHGAVIQTNAEVDHIEIVRDKVRSVVLKNGDAFEASVVASNLDPKRTFLQLIDPRHLDSQFVTAIRNFRCEGTSLKMNLAVSALPDFTALPGSTGPQHRATMHICPSMDYVEKAWDDAKYGRPSESPLLELTSPTQYDASLAPPGKHIIGIFLQYAPFTLREGTWDQLRDLFAKRVVEIVDQYAPGFSSNIEQLQILTPLDLEREFGLTGGNIFHGEMSLDQMFWTRPVAGCARYKTPIRGLYLCGSGTHPGGGVMGAPGHNAAREIMKSQ
jgi:phytoene dehydrogenase-like protein